MNNLKNVLTKERFWALLVFSISLSVYLFTLCPTIYLEDSAEFVTAAATLGIPHPSGYPLYVLLGKLFTFLPVGDIVWRINMMSAFFASLTCVILFLVFRQVLNLTLNSKQANKVAKDQFDNEFNNITSTILLLYYFVPFTTSLIFAFTLTFWSQAVTAEVYCLNTFFVMLCVWILLKWSAAICPKSHPVKVRNSLKSAKVKHTDFKQLSAPVPSQEVNKHQNRFLLWFAFVYGLSLTNHSMMILLAPVFLVYILLVDWKIIKNWRLMITAGALFILGFSVYLFLPLRSSMYPAMDWGRTREFKGFIYHLTRRQYSDFSWRIFSEFNERGKWLFIDSFFKELIVQFTWLSVVFSVIGFVWLWFKKKKIVFLTLGIFLMNSLAIILLRKSGFSRDNEEFFRVYYLPSYLMYVIWFGFGLIYLVKALLKRILLKCKDTKLKQDGRHRQLPIARHKDNSLVIQQPGALSPFTSKLILVISVLILFLLPISFMVNNFKVNNLSDFNFLNAYGFEVLNNLEPNSILIVFNEFPGLDNQIFSLAYWQIAKKFRTDVILVSTSGLFYQPTGQALKDFFTWNVQKQKSELAKYVWQYYSRGHPIYTLYSLSGSKDENYLFTRSNGLVYKVYKDMDEAKKVKVDSPILYITDEFNDKVLTNHTGIDLLADIYYARAAYYLENGYFDKSQRLFIKAFNLDYTPFSANAHVYIDHREKWLQDD